MKSLFIFGLGYTASRIADAVRARGWEVHATGSAGNIAFEDQGSIRLALSQATHILSSVPPVADGDPVLCRYAEAIRHSGAEWTGYLSSTGVYGDVGGAWVDEAAPVKGRRESRNEADLAWQALGTHVFRLPGIYGPRRSALERVADGKAHRIALPDQIFSRVHVDDIVSAVLASFGAQATTYNLADDLPCSQNMVIEEAARLLGMDAPPLQSLAEAQLSPAALAFYGENRRVSNSKAKRLLNWKLTYPTYVEGLGAINATTIPASATTLPAAASQVQL